MMGTGKIIRWSRFVDSRSGRGIIVPIDHGLTYGPIAGIESVHRVKNWIGHPAIKGIIAHKGIIERLANFGVLAAKGIMIHLNGMASLSATADTKELLTSVESAARLGADAVSIQLNFLPENCAHNLSILGAISDETRRLGMPMLAMVYDKARYDDSRMRIARLRHWVRSVYELGADAIKIEAPDDIREMGPLLADISDDVALFLSGGALTSDEQLLVMARSAVCAGATGVCVGRNIFQRSNPESILGRLWDAVTNVPEPLAMSTSAGAAAG
jgi:fructose-bisphosphate aldolase, class I